MASLKFIPVVSYPNSTATTVLTTATSASIPIPVRTIVRIVATNPVNIRFGNNVSTAAATDFYLPANVPEYIDMGDTNNSLCIYNAGGSTAVVQITWLSKA